MTYQKILLLGSTGSLGTKVLEALIANGSFEVAVLLRKALPETPSGVKATVVDFDSADALTASMRGQDVVIDATAAADPQVSIRLMDAAASAGVKRFIPSEFGIDYTNRKVRSLPVFQGKDAAMHHLQKLAGDGRLSFTAISNYAFLDWALWTGFLNIDLANKKVDLMNDGSVRMYCTVLSSVATAVVTSILKSEETKNRICYIYNIHKSQAELAALAQEALGAEGWQTTSTDMDKAFENARAEWSAGHISPQVAGDIIRYAASTPGFVEILEHDDNDLLNVSPLTDEEVKQIIKEVYLQVKAT
ncbi:isoflavone reductase [Colletotrichum tabaci]|uniref:Isoflavone reductase n=1 Tax=Colletotrichum tabaci TaxID=1209068 RepID=A0AAV9SYV8_9PEZI